MWIDAPDVIPGYACVRSDSYQGAVTGVQHLAEVHYHRRIGLVVGGAGSPNADPRQRGWQDALSAAGLEPGPFARVEWSREGGYAGGQTLLDLSNRPTAIFASSDLQAVGLLRAAHELGVRVPEDLAVIGFDGTKESEYCWPPLTVVAQPVQQMAQAAVQLVLAEDADKAHHAFAPELVIRRSCGCRPPEPTPAADGP